MTLPPEIVSDGVDWLTITPTVAGTLTYSFQHHDSEGVTSADTMEVIVPTSTIPFIHPEIAKIVTWVGGSATQTGIAQIETDYPYWFHYETLYSITRDVTELEFYTLTEYLDVGSNA